MIKNIIIAVLTIFLLSSLFYARIQKTHADAMFEMAQSERQRAEQFLIMSEHAHARAAEALKEAAFQQQQAAQQVGLLEAQLKKD